MADENQIENASAPADQPEGMAALEALKDTNAGTATETSIVAEPKIDEHGRSYATGRRKESSARVWLKRG